MIDEFLQANLTVDGSQLSAGSLDMVALQRCVGGDNFLGGAVELAIMTHLHQLWSDQPPMFTPVRWVPLSADIVPS